MGLASVVMAGENADAGISLHITDRGLLPFPVCIAGSPTFLDDEGRPKGGKAIVSKVTDCGGNNGIGSWDVWVVVCNGSDSVGVAGVAFGIEYDLSTGSGIDVLGWTSCGDLEFTSGGFPQGGGNVVTWEPTFNCQLQNREEDNQGNEVRNSVIAVAGAFRVFLLGGDQMEIVPHQNDGRLKVLDCVAREDDLTDAAKNRGGQAAFCTGRQYNFCRRGAMAGTQETTWGNIKTLYENNQDTQ
jgi:hypothetical protein